MSQEALKAFGAKLAADENLRNEMTRVLTDGGKKSSASVEEMVAFAKSRGYELTPGEVQQTMELSDDELNAVAGGITEVGTPGLKYESSLNYSVESYSFNFLKM